MVQDIKAEETAPFKFLQKEEHNKRPIVYAKKKVTNQRVPVQKMCVY